MTQDQIEHLSTIGKARAVQLKAADPQHFEKAGLKGGESLLASRGKDWFSELGKRSAASRAAKKHLQNGICPACGEVSVRSTDKVSCVMCDWYIYTFKRG